jgi:alkylation response protein AidB-like acyl-CoA dehydrogenase
VNLDLNETQSLLRDTVRSFLANEVPFDRVREIEKQASWDERLWRTVCEQGWIAVPFREAVGGASGSLTDMGLLVEEFARRAAIVPIAEVMACAWLLEHHVDDRISAPLIDGILSGAVRPVAADKADLVIGDGQVNGAVPFIDFGAEATHHLLITGDAGDEQVILVATDAEGVTSEPLATIGRTPTCRTRYDTAPAIVIGASAEARCLRNVARTLAAVQCVGSMQTAFDMTVEYAGFREQFGKAIGSFQAVKHHCANMAIRVESTRFLSYETLGGIENGRATDADIALTKAATARAVPEVTMLAHQVHGGNGVIEENDLYFFTLRAKDRSLAWGSLDECLDIAAADVDKPIDWL